MIEGFLNITEETMSKHVDDSVKENLNMFGKVLTCPKCGEKMEFYYDDDEVLQCFCPNCEKEEE